MANEKIDQTRYAVRVPLGDKDHPNESKGSTKIVKRKLISLKGSKPKRTAIVFWRGEHLTVKEDAEKAGHFEAGARAKKSDIPETTTKAKKAKTAPKAAPKKTAAKGKAKSKTAKESDTRSRKRAA